MATAFLGLERVAMKIIRELGDPRGPYGDVQSDRKTGMDVESTLWTSTSTGDRSVGLLLTRVAHLIRYIYLGARLEPGLGSLVTGYHFTTAVHHRHYMIFTEAGQLTIDTIAQIFTTCVELR